jgi:tRNA-dihydrouridine synthase B
MIDVIEIIKSKNCFLAPMAGIADRAYRETALRFGAAGATSEMISAKGLIYGDKKTAELCFIPPKRDGIYGLQLFTGEPETMAAAIEKILEMGQIPDFFDINMGCPVPKVVSAGAGSALMKTPETAAQMVASAVSAAKIPATGASLTNASAENAAGAVVKIPVTVKIRSGWDDNSKNAVSFAKMLEEAGAAAITVHGRTKTQGYSGKADLGIIEAVKKTLRIPVIGNGDINSPETAEAMFARTGADSIMVGRGSYGRPWIFRQINEHFKYGEYSPEPDFRERINIMTSQLKLAVMYKGEAAAMREARTQCAFYLKGFPGAAALREKCSHLKTLEDYYRLINAL